MNNRPVLVVPFEPGLLERLRPYTVIIRLEAPEDIPPAAAAVRDLGPALHCLWLLSPVPFDAVPLDESWADLPLAVQAPSLGKLAQTLGRISLLRRLDLRIDLPGAPAENISHLRILSSLGIRTALHFGDGRLDWEQASDLMTYALLGLAPHAEIDPFHYAASIYKPQQRTDFSAAYFDDGVKYLHVDANGRLARTRKDLLEGRYLAPDAAAYLEAGGAEPTVPAEPNWREHFLMTEGCAYCPGWRLCLGKFAPEVRNGRGCRRFFEEFLDVIEQSQNQQKKKKGPWQP